MLPSVVSLISSAGEYIWPRQFPTAGLLMDNTSLMFLYVKLNWDAYRRFLPAESKDCMISASYEYRNISASRRAVCAHGNADYLLVNFSREDHDNVVNKKLKDLDDVFSSALALQIWVLLHKIRPSRPKSNYLYLRFRLCVKEGVPYLRS